MKAWVEENAPPEPGKEGLDHVPGLLEQLSRDPLKRPTLHIADKPLDQLVFDDIRVENYEPHPGIKFAVAE